MILFYLTDFDFLWETCDDGRRCEPDSLDECDGFYIPTPENLKAYEIPKRLFEPIFEEYAWSDHTRCLEYFKCFLRGISELENTTLKLENENTFFECMTLFIK